MARALSVCVMMNKKTRRLLKMPVDVRTEIQGYFVEDERKLTKLDDNTAEHIRKGLTTRWSNLDINRHVNNVRYIGWILEQAAFPRSQIVCNRAQETCKEEYEPSVVDLLLGVLRTLDEERVAVHLKEVNGRMAQGGYDAEANSGEIVSLMFKVLTWKGRFLGRQKVVLIDSILPYGVVLIELLMCDTDMVSLKEIASNTL